MFKLYPGQRIGPAMSPRGNLFCRSDERAPAVEVGSIFSVDAHRVTKVTSVVPAPARRLSFEDIRFGAVESLASQPFAKLEVQFRSPDVSTAIMAGFKRRKISRSKQG
jgi:hypothetical protein